jgi:hypothetical protein
VNAAIVVTFSEAMDPSTISTATFMLSNGVTGSVTYNGTTATFTPSSNLAYWTTYTATITTGVKDAAGNTMAATKTWSFTTGAALDTTPPTVSSTNPASNATGVAVNAAITATFSETMDASTISTATFTMDNGVTGAVTYSGTTATFTPSGNLAYSTTYTATITTGVRDAAGNTMAAAKTWSFTTGSGGGVPAAPIGVFAISGIGNVTVTWSPITGATSYNLYWGTTPGITATSTQVTNVTPGYVHEGLTSDTTHYYRVGAANAGGETLSDEVFSFVYTGGAPAGKFGVRGMTSPRRFHTATLLGDGKVLMTGGANLATTELYDPATNNFTATGSMTSKRYEETATLLGNGKVLIAGGSYGSNALATAELYDTATNTFTATIGSMTAARYGHTATPLSNGKVLIAGGYRGGAGYLATAELYDPATDTFTATAGSMTDARYDHTATPLGNGKVLIAGGISYDSLRNQVNSLATAELYDPATDTFTATAGLMTDARAYHTATLLSNGRVLIAGGSHYIYSFQTTTIVLNSSEVYDPVADTYISGKMHSVRSDHTATLLSNGKVLIVGGSDGGSNYALATTELYDPVTGTFTPGRTNYGHAGHTATMLRNGKVLIVDSGVAELYDPATNTFTSVGGTSRNRAWASATLLSSGKVLIAGGTDNFPSVSFDTAELYDPATNTFTATVGKMNWGRFGHKAMLLNNGKVLLAGGYGNRSVELYDPATDTFGAAGSSSFGGVLGGHNDTAQ